MLLVAAGLVGLMVWRFGLSWDLPAFVVFAAAAALLAAVDLRHALLPNRVLVPALVAGAILLTGAALPTGDWAALLRAGIAAVSLFGILLVLALISPRSLGMGDVKLAALLGLHLGWIGWQAVYLGVFLGFLLQAVVGLALLLARRVGRRSELPFGPALLAGALAAVVLAGDGAGLLAAW